MLNNIFRSLCSGRGELIFVDQLSQIKGSSFFLSSLQTDTVVNWQKKIFLKYKELLCQSKSRMTGSRRFNFRTVTKPEYLIETKELFVLFRNGLTTRILTGDFTSNNDDVYIPCKVTCLSESGMLFLIRVFRPSFSVFLSSHVIRFLLICYINDFGIHNLTVR